MSKRKPASSLLLIDADDRIVADVLCIRCGHNLNGLFVADRCPQCTHPASDSVHGDYLIHADRPLVRGLAEAARVVEYGTAILGGLMALALLAVVLSAPSLTGAVEPAYRVVFAGAVISPIIATVGLILLTTRHTAAYYWVRYGNRRALLRFGLLFALALAVIVICALYFGHVALEIGIVFWFVIPLGAFFRGVERLMRRVPNNQLATFARATFVGLLAFSLLAIIIILIRQRACTDRSWEDSLTAFSAINCMGGIALGLAAHQLLIRVRRTLSSIAH
jgi:hypothetical protein